MHGKNIRWIITKQLKKSLPGWKKITRKSKKELTITCRMVLPPSQHMGFAVGLKVILEDLLYNAWFHSIPGGCPGLIFALQSLM
jgi:hypothetical protein